MDHPGAHTFGRFKCGTFSSRLSNFSSTGNPDPILNASYLRRLRKMCPQNGADTNLTNLDFTTPNKFDKTYYSSLKIQKGLQVVQTADTIYMGNISPLTESQGEIKQLCKFVNGQS